LPLSHNPLTLPLRLRMEESLVKRESELLVTSHLIPAYGDQLINPMAAPVLAEELKARASYLPSVGFALKVA